MIESLKKFYFENDKMVCPHCKKMIELGTDHECEIQLIRKKGMEKPGMRKAIAKNKGGMER